MTNQKLPVFIRRDIERAIEDALHPAGMGTHDGKARIGVDRLQYLIRMIDGLPAEPVNDGVLEFLRAFIAGGVNQDFKLWASELYQKLYRGTVHEPKGNEQLLSAIRAIVEQSHDRDSDALAMGEISDLLKAAPVKPVGAIEDLPFIPIKPEVLQAFAKQMLDWGIVWVKYSPGGQAEVVPRDQVMQWPATENRPAEPT